MDPVPTTNSTAGSGVQATATVSTAGSQVGHFGGRQVSVAPDTPRTGPVRVGVFASGASATDRPGITSGASGAAGSRNVPGTLPEPSPKRRYRTEWSLFMRWCNAHHAQHWPASPETVAAYLKDRPNWRRSSSLWSAQTAISGTYEAAGLRDPCRSDLVKATMKDLIRAAKERLELSPRSAEMPPDTARLDAIRTTALDPRRHGTAPEISEDARGSVLVDDRLRRSAGGVASDLSDATARTYTSNWRSFCRWCDGQGAAKLPASAETVAAYFRYLGETLDVSTIASARAAIAREHVRTGLANPCATELVAATMRDLRSATTILSPTMLRPSVIEAIRATAPARRLRGVGLETPETARRRGLVDIALCSVMYEANLSARRAADLRWGDVEEQGEDEARLTIRSLTDSAGCAKVVALAGQAVRDLRAIRGTAGPEQQVFELCKSAIYRRLNQAAKAAGLGAPATAGPSGSAA